MNNTDIIAAKRAFQILPKSMIDKPSSKGAGQVAWIPPERCPTSAEV
jgi:hypothetical protein